MNGNQDEWIIKLNETVKNLQNQIVDCKDAFDGLVYRINNLEVKLDNLRVEYDHHQFHPQKFIGPDDSSQTP